MMKETLSPKMLTKNYKKLKNSLKKKLKKPKKLNNNKKEEIKKLKKYLPVIITITE